MARTRSAASPPPAAGVPAEPPKPARPRRTPAPAPAPERAGPSRLADAALVALFLALIVLLGMFPLKDTDFWWHLRTGDLIRRTGAWPQTDWYTFGAEGRPWIDLHWIFQVLVSLGYEHVGVPGLTLAKCVVTAAAVLVLLLARARTWPIWAMILAWLPALLVLGGRMYIRPETLTLLYLAVFLAVLSRWREWPRPMWALPLVQVLWVNTQGLFVLGPIVLGFALVDAALRRGAFAAERRRWWRDVAIVTVLVGLACLVNPYGLRGALFPLELVGTMGNPVFSSSIAELMPVPVFIEQMGLRILPLQLHLATMALGALSFVVPILWGGTVRVRDARSAGLAVASPAPADGKGKRRKRKGEAEPTAEAGTPIRPFRLLLFVAFSLLSFKATRNTHQFAAVVGAVTAWNVGEWLAAVRARRQSRGEAVPAPVLPRLATAGVLLATLGFVGSGAFYALAGEGRTIGLGEEPQWFPHDAAKAAGAPGMPERFVLFHNGHSALYEYYHGPARKTFADARLEVIGPELHGQYLALERQVRTGSPGWEAALLRLGNPGVLVDLVQPSSAELAARLLGAPGWKCVWLDGIAAVFAPPGTAPGVPAVDFAARHFRREAAALADPAAARALAKALAGVALHLRVNGQIEVLRPILLVGLDAARRLTELDPAGVDGWKQQGLLESVREPLGSPDEPVPRFRLPFDPVFDLSRARATYALEEARRRAPDDSRTLLALAMEYQSRGMWEAALPLLERLAVLDPPGQRRALARQAREQSAYQAARCLAELGPAPPSGWKNLDELERAVRSDLETGRARSAAELIERAYPARSRSWETTDRLATLWLHLGEPARARAAWRSAPDPPRPALVAARVAASHLVEGDFDAARPLYARAIAAEPELFEAHHGLAVLEADAGRAREALAAATRAEATAPTDLAREASRAIAALARGYAAGAGG
jgi:tetratricopeptide (TPR) repeat protein